MPASVPVVAPVIPASSTQAKPASVPVAAPVTPASSTQAMVVQLPKDGLNVRVTGTPDDYLTPGIQIFVAVLSATLSTLAILWQLRRQRDQAMEQHHLNVKADLRLEAYRDFQSCFRQFSDAGNFAIDILSLKTNFSIAIDQLKANVQPIQLIQRAPALMEKLRNRTDRAIDLIFFIERYESLLPGFDIFRTAISCALHDISRVNVEFQRVLIDWLPMEHAEYGRHPAIPQFINNPTITDAALNELNAVSDPLEKALNQLESWAIDLSVEIQNHLLGKYADQKVKRREAPDQTFFTITADASDRKRLDALFKATEFGRVCERHENEAKAHFGDAKQP